MISVDKQIINKVMLVNLLFYTYNGIKNLVMLKTDFKFIEIAFNLLHLFV